MTEKAKRALVPKLRFPEFREADEWESKPLAKVCNVFQGYGFPDALQGKSEGKYPFCKVSDISRAVAESGGLLAEATNYVGDDDLLKLRAKPIPKGATVFAKIGEALRLNRRAYVQKECLIDNNATGLKAIDGVADDYFVYLLTQLIDLNKHCGGAVPSVNKSTLEEIEVVVPGPDEQKQIADCLSSLDELITLETQKLDTLKTHKKGLMQQLFPAEGETLPKLRFPEFRDAGEWEEKLLGTVCGMQAGKFVAASEISEKHAEGFYPCFGGNGLRGYTKTFNQSGRYSLIGRQGALCGNVNLVEGDFYATEHAVVTTPKPGNSIDWLFYNLCFLNLNRFATGQAQPGLSIDVLEKVNCAVPKDEEEQQKIADCLSSLDDLITAQTQKLAALKTHKKGLMQQLFASLS